MPPDDPVTREDEQLTVLFAACDDALADFHRGRQLLQCAVKSGLHLELVDLTLLQSELRAQLLDFHLLRR